MDFDRRADDLMADLVCFLKQWMHKNFYSKVTKDTKKIVFSQRSSDSIFFSMSLVFF